MDTTVADTAVTEGAGTHAATATSVDKQEKHEMPAAYKGLGYHELNAMLNLYGPNGEIQFEADREAAVTNGC